LVTIWAFIDAFVAVGTFVITLWADCVDAFIVKDYSPIRTGINTKLTIKECFTFFKTRLGGIMRK
jgi:hypothetical protein